MTDTKQHDRTHGGPFDRGSADAYYGRQFRPHYCAGKSRVQRDQMTADEIAAYRAGYDEAIEADNVKIWD